MGHTVAHFCFLTTIYISMKGSKRHILAESILIDELPNDVKQAIIQNRTSLGNNPAIPDIYEIPYLLRAMKSQFESAKDDLKRIGKIDSVDDTSLKSALASLINKCKKLEEPHKNELEKICFNYIIDLLSVPEDSVELRLDLVDQVDISGEPILLDPNDGNDGEQFDDVNSAISTRSEIYKRRILLSTCMGAGLYVAENMGDSVVDEIQKICPELLTLYYQILVLNRYLLFTAEEFGMSDEDPLQLGTVEVYLGAEDEKTIIHSQGLIFPILLCETVRGFFELFISHGLPEDINAANEVIRNSDYLKAEPWDMRIGPHIWNMISKSVNDVTFEDMPYLFKRISSLDVDKFNFFMKEILAGTKKGRRLMSKICNKAKRDSEYDKFVDRMTKMKKDNGIITDDYIHADEL